MRFLWKFVSHWFLKVGSILGADIGPLLSESVFGYYGVITPLFLKVGGYFYGGAESYYFLKAGEILMEGFHTIVFIKWMDILWRVFIPLFLNVGGDFMESFYTIVFKSG